MTPPQPRDALDARVARSATGLLAQWNQAEVLDAADIHVAVRLARLGHEVDDHVLLALALVVRAARTGSTCLNLADVGSLAPDLECPDPEPWAATLAGSLLTGPNLPLRWDLGRLYLDRYWQEEVQICTDLLTRDARPAPLIDIDRASAAVTRVFDGADTLQARAAVAATRRWTTVLAGGPGTGKTTTVARLLAVLADQPGRPLRYALAAPTGKAAARLAEAVQDAAEQLGPADRGRLGPIAASTLHRLLGFRPGNRNRYRHNRDNKLPFDVVVVDEASMLSLTQTARLMEALRPDTRLILVGDPDQLASVEAGAVLSDLVEGITSRPDPAAAGRLVPEIGQHTEPGIGDGRVSGRVSGPVAGEPGGSIVDGSAHGVVRLQRVWRFGGDIARLATAVREGDPDAALAVLAGPSDSVRFSQDGLRADVVDSAMAIRSAAEAGDAGAALQRMLRHRLVCAHRSGPDGVTGWTQLITEWLAEDAGLVAEGEWYVGRPLLVTANDYSLGLFNGDTGVVVRAEDGSMRAAFPRRSGFVLFAPSRLTDIATVHAMTVHRSQGSQFAAVTVALPAEDSPLLTRELFYTGLTRAQEHLRVVGTAEQVRAAIDRPAARATGLRDRLAGAG